MDCDLLLTGGRVIDPETGLDEVVDVAVSGGTVVSVGGIVPRATRTLDVTGRVVTAGFIDMHSHAQSIPSLRLQALDGVTTALELEFGAGDVAASLAGAATEGRPVNYGYSASWAQARMAVLDGVSPTGGFLDFTTGVAGPGWRRPADAYELAKILGRLEEQLAAGALGIGVLAGYAPQTTHSEYLQVASAAAGNDVPTFTHARSKSSDEPGTALEGVAELVTAAAHTGAHMHLCHMNSTALRAIDEVADLISEARARGLRVTTEAYPYGAGMTVVGAPFLHPDSLRRAGIGPPDLTVVATGERPRDADRLLQIRRETPDALVVVHYLDERREADLSVISRALLLDDTAIASDAIPFTTPDGVVVDGDRPLPPDAVSHPRTTGTFSRFLRMARETDALSLAEALRRCSLLPAQLLERASPAMRRKGRVQAGVDADLVVFDPDHIADRSTYDEPQHSSTGIQHVLVGGEPVVRDGRIVTSAMPGQPVVRDAG